MAEPFNLTQLIRQVLDETDLAEPTAIAEKVAAMVPPKHRLAALQQALPTFVRVTVTRNRGPMAQAAARQTGRTQSARSAKVAAIRQAAPAWKRALRERIHVGRGRWELLGKCSYDELMFAVTERRHIAAQVNGAADRYEKVAVAVSEYGVSTPEDLPESVLAELFPSDDEEAAA